MPILVRRRPAPAGLVLTALAVALLVVTTGVLRSSWGIIDDQPQPGKLQSDVPHARQLLDQVPVKGRAAKTGYDRDRFGSGWASVAGCDVRNQILARDLVDVTYRAGGACVVATGTLHDPYSGTTVPFTRGENTSSLIQVDHRYPLSLSWQQGAQSWTADRREAFANDPANLQAVEGRVNQAKGDSGPGSWLPPNRAYRCHYVAAFVEVADRWELSMNPGDHRAAAAVLNRC